MTIHRLPAIVNSRVVRSLFSPATLSKTHKKTTNESPTSTSLPVRLLDTSWMRDDHIDGYTEYFRKAHIPGAIHFDLDTLHHSAGPESMIDCPIPNKSIFQDYVRSLGISNDDHLIVYDSVNRKPSVRSWYLFRLFGHDNISVLDGGLQQWAREGHDLESGDVDMTLTPPGSFEANFRSEMLVTYSKLLDILASKSAQIVDARWQDGVPTPDYVINMIPGSKNVTFASLFKDGQIDGPFVSAEEFRDLFVQSGVDLDKPVVTTCFRGLTACGLALACHVIGVKDIAMYNGSAFEWDRQRNFADITTKILKEGK